VAYLCTLPLQAIQTAPDDRVATAALQVIFGPAGAAIMAIAIIISTFGCNNGLILAGARVSYAMACDGLFFRRTGTLNAKHVPAFALILQCVWASLLVLPRTRITGEDGAVTYGNVYSTLLDYVVFAVLIFYVLTVGGLYKLRLREGNSPPAGSAPVTLLLPTLYCIGATIIMVVLLAYKTDTTWPGLIIVLLGVPVFLAWSGRSAPPAVASRD